MQRQRVSLTVTVDLDPVPGSFHTPENVKENIHHMLLNYVPHYHPVVVLNEEVSPQ